MFMYEIISLIIHHKYVFRRTRVTEQAQVNLQVI